MGTDACEVEVLYTKEYHYAYMLNFKGKGRLTWQDQGPIAIPSPSTACVNRNLVNP